MVYHFLYDNLMAPVIIKFFDKNKGELDVEQRFLIVYDSYENSKKDPNHKYYKIKESLVGKSEQIFIEAFMKSTLNENDKFIIHGCFGDKVLRFLAKSREYIQKCVWCVWGGDLYTDMEELKEINEKKRGFQIMLLRKEVYREIPIVCQFRTSEVIKKIYGEKVCFISKKEMYYPNSLEISNQAEKGVNEFHKSPNKVIFLIGNSGTPSNYHEEILLELERFKDENIQLIVPLSYSYGDTYYIQRVIKRGKQIFGEKFVPLLSIQAPKDYIETLASVDIAIFNHRIQEGGGSIRALCLLKKKIYFRNDNPFFLQCKDDGIKVEDTCKLSQQSWRDLTSYDITQMNRNAEIMREIYREDKMVALWKKILSDRVIR